jgi:DNA-binding beta-propeller fold protein YncE
MRRLIHLAVGAGAVLGLSAWVAPVAAGAEGLHHGRQFDHGDAHAVFVQTNDPTGNQIVSYQRGWHGQLALVGRYDTGGLGVALTGAKTDKLASQSGLAYDDHGRLLVAVNGGSDTITAFHVHGARLDDPQAVSSGGTIPVSVTIQGDVLYVLNAGGTGSVQGFYTDSLTPIPGSARPLNLVPNAIPQFLNTPGQIGLTPDGGHLVVTTKLNGTGTGIDVFGVSPGGSLSATPTVNASANPVPFGFTFDPAGDLVMTEAGAGALTTYAIHGDGSLTKLGSVTNGQAALCWVANADNAFYYGANTGSGTVTGYTIGAGGIPTIVGETTTDPGPIDLAASPDGSALYVETGLNGIVDGFAVNSDGSLTFTGSVAPELPGHTGLEGIVVA